MEYNTIFSKRADTYLYALKTYPAVLANEFRTAVEMCQVGNDDIFLLIPCSCENIQPWLPKGIKYIEFETNKELAILTNKTYCQFDSIPLSSESVTRILSLATLHHLTNKERSDFYKESIRLLQPGGKLIIGDVIQDSPQDKWLNSFVNLFNSHGHKGRFFTDADAELLKDAGFQVEIRQVEYVWDFQSIHDMIVFCRNLFHLDCATDIDIKEGLQTYFNITKNNLQWKLIYFICTKPNLNTIKN